jgi:chromosome segregation ATPase
MLQTLGVDKKYVIAHAKEEAMLLKSELQRAHVEHDRLEHDCTEQKRQQNHHQHRLRTNTEKTEMLSNKISELKDLVEASTTFQMDTGDHEEDIMNLERELEEVDIKDEKISDETSVIIQEIEPPQSRNQ